MTELFRPVAVSKIRPDVMTMHVRATPEECAAIAARMDVPAIRSLECAFALGFEDGRGRVRAQGRLRVELTQVCVVSAEEFEARVEDAFEIILVPSGQERDDPDPDMIDEVPYDGDTVDLGEIAVEQLALAMDPYPRMEGAALPDIVAEAEPSLAPLLSRPAMQWKTRR